MKPSCLYNPDRVYTAEEIAAHIKAVMLEDDYRLCPGLREAACHAPFVTQDQFVAGAVLAGINKNTAAIQFRNQRKNGIQITREDVQNV